MTAGDVMDSAAALLNDTALTNFTYAKQIPYLNIAMRELQEECESNNVPMSNATSAVLVVPVGTVTIGPATTPALPTDLIEIQGCYERLTGTNDPFVPLTRVDFLPLYQSGQLFEDLIYFQWANQAINFLGATSSRDVKLNYIAAVLPVIASSTTTITMFNSISFLSYRTAALCAQFIGENKERADDLNVDARLGLDRVLNINTKGRQSTFTRRRPFMAGYKVRQGF